MSRLSLLPIALLGLALAAGPALAKPKAKAPGKQPAKAALPAKTAPIGGVLEAVAGKVDSKQPEAKFKPAKLGQVLFMGASVRTGSGGKASLRLADGNLVRLAPNSELQVKESAKEGGSLLKLAKGMGRFLVAKIKGGKSFKVETANAVAAVKGTDWEGETGGEGQSDEFRVYESENPEALEVRDEDTGESRSIGEGEELLFDGSEFKEERISDEERQASNESFQELPPAEIRPMETPAGEGSQEGQGGEGNGQGQGGEQGQAGEQGQGGEQAQGEGEGSGEGGEGGEQGLSDAELEAALYAELEQLYEDQALDGQLEGDLRSSDRAAGKVIYDRFGNLVQVDNYIERPYADTVRKSVYTYRDTGEHAGYSFAEESTTFNQALPEDWTTVYYRALEHPDNLDPLNNNYPIYYRSYQSFFAGNPYGDLLDIETTFQLPSWGYGCVGLPEWLQQGWAQEVWVSSADNGLWVNKGLFENYAQWSDPVNHVAVAGLSGSDCAVCTGENFSKTRMSTHDGGWSIEYTNTTTTQSMFTQTIHVTDDDGNVLDLGGYDGVLEPTDFRGLPDTVNLEVNFAAPEFNGRSIDLIFIPSFFDAFDFYTLPDGYFAMAM